METLRNFVRTLENDVGTVELLKCGISFKLAVGSLITYERQDS
jgi:hypothetical protein